MDGLKLGLTCLLFLAVAEPLIGQVPADTFAIVFNQHSHVQSRDPAGNEVLLVADEISLPDSYGLIELRAGPSLVAVFQLHHVVLIANRSRGGSRSFVVRTSSGSFTISADRMLTLNPNGPITFWVGDDPVGVVNPQAALLVADSAVTVESSGSSP